MPKTIPASTRGSGRASARAVDLVPEDEPMTEDDRPRADLLIAALLGAALGAGIGLIAARGLAPDEPTVLRTARRVRRSASRALHDAPSAVGNLASDARRAVEEAVERELRQMRRAMRRRRRELGL